MIANRSGRQAIRCKAIIDATHNASVAGLSGAERKPFTAGTQEFCYTVVGNTKKEAPEIILAEELSQPIKVGEKAIRSPAIHSVYRSKTTRMHHWPRPNRSSAAGHGISSRSIARICSGIFRNKRLTAKKHITEIRFPCASYRCKRLNQRI